MNLHQDKNAGIEKSQSAKFLNFDFKNELSNTWKQKLNSVWTQDYFLKLLDFLETENKKGKTIYPAEDNLFKALKLCDFENTKVVILGQDPYHGEGQAHGLSFSVCDGVPFPPSLKNIFKELETDLGPKFKSPKSGNLTAWAKQGVLLLNTTLTVEAGKPASHQGQGWELFTDLVITELAQDPRPKVFILWGSHAHKKTKNINLKNHKVIYSNSPQKR